MKGPIRPAQTPQQMTMTVSQYYSLLANQIADLPDADLELKAIREAIAEMEAKLMPIPAKVPIMLELATAMAAFQVIARRLREQYRAIEVKPLIQVAQPGQVPPAPRVNGHNRLRVVE